MRLKTESVNNRPGVLLKRRAPSLQDAPPNAPISMDDRIESPAPTADAIMKRGGMVAAYVCIYLFTLLLYLRPGEMFPALGALPIVKVVTILAVLTYLLTKSSSGGRTVLAIEAKMMLMLVLVAIMVTPLAASPQDSINTLEEPFIKVVIVFILLTNLVDTRQRLFAFWKLVVIFGGYYGFKAIQSFQNGQFSARGERITGLVQGMFGNPNDLATSLDLLIPFAIVLALTQRGVWRLLYLGCAMIMMVGVVVTFSRGGFLGLVALGATLAWKLGRRRRLLTIAGSVLMVGVLSAVMPGGFGSRLSSVTDINADKTGSAQERWALMQNTARVALKHPFTGVGMGNIHIYSIRELVAHNAYLEIAAELGIFGLIAYMTVLIAPIVTLRRVERRTGKSPPGPDREMFYMSVGVQAAMVAYMVCSFFSSIQYQWYVYYVAAYAVALRRIDAAEIMESAVEAGSRENELDFDQRAGAVGALGLPARTGDGIFANPAGSR